MDGGGRQREEGTTGRENPGADRDLIAQVVDCKGEATGRGKSDTGLYKEFLGNPSREESADKRWRPTGGVTSRRTVNPRLGEMGSKKRVQRYREASTGEIWRAIGDRSGGRETRNEQSRKREKKFWGGRDR